MIFDNPNAKVIVDRSLILQKESLRQISNKGINDFILTGENDAIICIYDEDAVIPKEETWVNSTLSETLPKETLS